jgi:hypothetical protein
MVLDGGTARYINTENLLVRIPGTAPTGTILLTAHYDSPPLSPGAGDDGIGVAAVLEVARVLAAGAGLRNDVLILLADGGALHQAGVRAFVEDSSALDRIGLVISAEMRGVRGPVIAAEHLTANHTVVHALASTPSSVHATSLLRHLSPPGGLDPWTNAGLPLVRLSGLGGSAHHDQVTDRAEAVSERTLQHMGSQLLALSREFGSRDLDGGIVPETGQNQAYFTLPWIGLVHHPADWGFLLSFGLLGAWVLLAAFARFRGGTYRGFVAGFLLGILLLAGSAAVGWGLLAGLRGLHPEYGIVESAFFRDDIHFLLLVALVVALGTGAYGLAREKFSLEELGPGALAVPLALAVWWGIRIPLGATTLQWAVALSILSNALFVGLRRREGARGWLWAGTILLAGGIMAIVAPDVEIVAALLTFRGAAWVGTSLALGLLLLLPAVEWLLMPRKWLMPAMAMAVGSGFFVASLPSVQGAEHHPTFTSLIYLVNEEISGANPGMEIPEGESVSEASRRVRGQWLTVPGPGEAWARSWVVEEATGDLDPGDLLLPGSWGFVTLGTGPETHMPLPVTRIERDSLASVDGGLRLEIRSGLGGEMLGVHLLDEGAEVAGMEGRSWGPVTGTDPIRTVVRWGQLTDGALPMDIRLPAGQDTVRIEILEHHLRPREVLGGDFFFRDPSQVANAPAGSDRIVQRTRVLIPLGTSGEG